MSQGCTPGVTVVVHAKFLNFRNCEDRSLLSFLQNVDDDASRVCAYNATCCCVRGPPISARRSHLWVSIYALWYVLGSGKQKFNRLIFTVCTSNTAPLKIPDTKISWASYHMHTCKDPVFWLKGEFLKDQNIFFTVTSCASSLPLPLSEPPRMSSVIFFLLSCF